MSSPYVGEIRMFAGNFAPAGWMFCQGQLLPISENEVLFQLIGTTYGGDGQQNFALPNLSSRVPIHQGQGPDGITYVLAQAAGTQQETLTVQQIPSHTHPELASTAAATDQNPTGRVLAVPNSAQPGLHFYGSDSDVPMSNQAIGPTGGNQPHENTQPFLVISFIIALFGLFPTQT